MRSIVELLSDLRSKSVALTLEDDALKCSAPKGVLTKELREELAARKPEIISFLRTSHDPWREERSVIPRIDRSGLLPLSFAQQRLWFLNQLDPDSPVYNIPITVRMRGRLDIPALERALIELVHRHEDMRTSFIVVDGMPQTRIEDARDWSLQVVDVRHLSDGDENSELLEYARKIGSEPFDIMRGPLFRAALLIAGEDHHVLQLTMHHIISDGWSFGVLLREFAELYAAYTTGREPRLIPLTIQYVDFAAWQRKSLESGELERQLPYWKKQLAGSPPVLGFPADHRRRNVEMFSGSRSKLDLPKELIRDLEQLSQAHSVTLFMTLVAAFNLLLARYTGQDDIVIGSPSANRGRAELHQLIGFFVNNLVLRTDLSGNPTFAELLGRVREVTLRAYEHQDVPFDMLVRALRPERSVEHSPLFQVMFILQNFPLEDEHLPGLVTTPVELRVETARFDLTVEVFTQEKMTCAFFDYNSELYDLETIQRIQRHYLAILKSVLVDPTQAIGSIPLLSWPERQKLLVDWNGTEVPIPDLCFHQQFEAHADTAPDRIAIMAGDHSLTYRELNDRANHIATLLRVRGAGPEMLVALCLGRSSDLVAGMLGVAKSGAAYIPLDPAYPKGRIANIFEDAKPLIALTTTDLLPLLPVGSIDVLCLDDLDAQESERTPTRQTIATTAMPVRPENLAYVIFTSGSTGRPKGVQITHRALVNFLESMQREPGFAADDVLLALTTVSFDIAGLELLLPLYTGATVCVALQPGDPSALLADIERYCPTVMQATPATWKLLVAAGWKGSSTLKILCGGEALDTVLARSLLVRSESLWNMYGPTETTIWSAVLRVEEAGASAIPVGRPIHNTSFYVLDPLGQPVPQGVPGELWIGGEGLARGYLSRPELTAERFVVSAVRDSDPGERLYRTGDLVRYRADGTLDFFGRMDHQVKFRGFRIELGEIENTLRGCLDVLDAVTLLREDNGDKQLVAYLVCAKGEQPSLSMIRDQLRATLPEYMIPGAFVFLEEFPRLPNGKLDRAVLRAPDHSAGDSNLSFAEPVTTLQQSIAAAFRNVLNVEQVGLDDNFFDVGAHSLQIVKIHGELNRNLDVKIPLISFFQYPTIRSLTGFIDQRSQKETCSASSERSETSR
jgi:amino acid adenylation domain-containing protein